MNREETGTDPDLDRLVTAVSNGEEVDWQEEVHRRPDLEPLIEPLRIAESVAEYHRSGDHEKEAALTRWGPLVVREKIGEGGPAEVFRAFDTRLQVEVAFKLLRYGTGEERMLQEGRRMARVRHPNVLLVHGADCHGKRTGLWTELIRGQTLEELLAIHGPLSSAEATSIGLDLCRALAAVHAAGLVHRDVKTNNVMREQGGRIVLMDFGAGAERGPAGNDGWVEDGTLFVMAPEQLHGERATPASDIYSLGVLLYRLVSARFPVEAETYSELQALHHRGVRNPLRDFRADLPARFIAVVEKALAPDPENRFSSAGELERALMGSHESSLADAPTSPSHRPSRWLLAAALVVIAGGVWLAFAWRDSRTGTGDVPQAGTSSPASDVLDRPLPTTTGPRSDRSSEPHASTPGGEGGTVRAVPLVASAALLLERTGKALGPGDRIQPGDALALQFQSEEPLHVYVLDEDAKGEVFVLFPAPGTELTNPLSPRTLHRLPGRKAGRRLSWRVTSAGGRETVIAIATRRPFEALEREIARFPAASLERPVVYERLSDEALANLRGIGGMVESSPEDPGRVGRLSDLVRRLSATQDPGTPWTWQIELQNPR